MEDIIKYINENYKLNSIDDFIYRCGTTWGKDLNGKYFTKIKEEDIFTEGYGTDWFSYDNKRFSRIKKPIVNKDGKIDWSINRVSDDNSYTYRNEDSFMDSITDPMNPLNPFSPFNIYDDNE